MEEGGEAPNPALFGHGGNGSGAKLKLAIGGGIFLFVVVFSAVIIVDSVHTIEEGNVGIYFVQGALDDTYTLPGVHWSIPFVTVIEEITMFECESKIKDYVVKHDLFLDDIMYNFHLFHTFK